jgi:hypothetical protein
MIFIDIQGRGASLTAKDKWNYLAPCGIYCGECRAFIDGQCKGCRSNEGAAKCNSKECKIALCVGSKKHKVCMECDEFPCSLFDYFRARRLEDSVWYIDVVRNMKELNEVGLDELCRRKDAWVKERVECAKRKGIGYCDECKDWPCRIMSNPVQINEPSW